MLYDEDEFNKIMMEKRDSERFLQLIAPKYIGVYVVDTKTDMFRDIVGPEYFRVLVKDTNGCFSEAMHAYCEKLVDESCAKMVEELLDYDHIRKHMKKRETIERQYRKKDGMLVKVSVQPYSEDEDDKDLSMWIFTNESSADAIFGSLGEARWSIEFDEDNDLARVFWNDGAVHTLGYPKNSGLSGDMGDVFKYLHPEDHKRTTDAFEAAMNDKDGTVNFDIEHRFKTGSGEYKWFRSIGRLMHFENNSAARFYGLILDINEQKHTEFRRQRELADALAAAEYANEAKTKFLNNMSHDIRTPMNAIIGFTALAARHIDDKDKIKDALAKITTSSNHLLSLINDVLDMSRIESGKVKIDEKEVHLPDVFHELRSILQSDIASRRIDLLFDTLGVKNEDVICDRLRLNQILLNLLSNAMKFTEPGGTVSVRVIQKANAPTGYADYEIRVKDNGIGMSEEFQTHIFEAFAREETSTVSGIQGTGLGMAITKNIVDMMGGTISVTSKEGVGTEFVVDLQFRLCTNPIVYDKIEELQDVRALVIDDDMDTCCSVSSMLGDIGMRADWTTTGREAVVRTQFAMSCGDNYGVFIVDWMMPDMNGIEIVRRIRRVIGDDTPIIIMTAYDWTDIEDEAREAGVTAFCAKPIFMSELRDVLSKPFRVEPKTVEPEKEGHDFSGKSILLVEDNTLNSEIAEEILHEAGFKVDTADDGDIAVSKMRYAQKGQYDAVLMDVQMPRMDGYTATREIRTLQNPYAANIPIIATTANAFEEDKKAALEAGMNGHISKPLDIEHLLSVLADVLR